MRVQLGQCSSKGEIDVNGGLGMSSSMVLVVVRQMESVYKLLD